MTVDGPDWRRHLTVGLGVGLLCAGLLVAALGAVRVLEVRLASPLGATAVTVATALVALVVPLVFPLVRRWLSTGARRSRATTAGVGASLAGAVGWAGASTAAVVPLELAAALVYLAGVTLVAGDLLRAVTGPRPPTSSSPSPSPPTGDAGRQATRDGPAPTDGGRERDDDLRFPLDE